MRLNPNATATIVIGGLALCHQNKKADIWEVVFLRSVDNFHNLKMRIPRQADVEINKGDKISVKVTSPISNTGSHEIGTFRRRTTENIGSDARWTLDFSSDELHNRPLLVEKHEDDNFLVIQSAKFYTWNLSDFSYLIQKKQNGTSVGDAREFERIGQFMAGDIECEEGGSVSIEIESDTETKTYQLRKGEVVFFDNRCLVRTLECRQDFHHYYDIIETNGETFDLMSFPAPTSELQLQGLFGSQDNCESGQVGKVCKCLPDTCPDCDLCAICDDSIGGN